MCKKKRRENTTLFVCFVHLVCFVAMHGSQNGLLIVACLHYYSGGEISTPNTAVGQGAIAPSTDIFFLKEGGEEEAVVFVFRAPVPSMIYHQYLVAVCNKTNTTYERLCVTCTTFQILPSTDSFFF